MKLRSLLHIARHQGLIGVLAAALVSCADTELAYDAPEGSTPAHAPMEVETPGGLIQKADGTWLSQNCRVPIVGPGRIVNEINASTVSVADAGNGKIENVVDTDLTNVCELPVSIGVGVAVTPIISVKDLYHTYAAGQKVGFVYKDTQTGGAKLLSLDLLKGMTLETYLKGKKQESGYSDQTNGLKLDLISFNTGGNVSDRVLAFEATKPFDEVRMSFTGVDATVASNIALAIKYAFVGENPEIRATSEPEFKYFWTGGTPSINNGALFTNVLYCDRLVDDDLDNTPNLFTVALAIPSIATINFHRNIEAGMEAGFYYSGDTGGSLGLFAQDSPTLVAYDSNGKEVERSTPSQTALSVCFGGKTDKTFTNMILTKECSQLKFQHPSKLIEAGGMHVYYAYVREPVSLDPANYFTFGDDVTYNYSYRLPEAAEGCSVKYCILSQPYGTNPKIDETDGKAKIVGMTKDGAYRVQALFTGPDGRQVSQTATIRHLSNEAGAGCNTFITASGNGAYATNALNTSACVLCIYNGTNDLNNVVDDNPDNYATTGQLSLLGQSPLAAFRMNTPIDPKGEKIRVGFTVQANSQLIGLDALTHFDIRLYDGETLVSETAAGEQNVSLDLIGFDQSKMRLSAQTDRKFDRIELWSKNVANIGQSLRIYNIFREPLNCDETFGAGGGCMEMMSNLKDNLQVDYDNTRMGGLVSVGSSFSDLEYMIDSDYTTGATLNNGLLSLASAATVSLKFDPKKANQAVGIILKGINSLANLSLINAGTLQVYSGDKLIASTASADVLGVSLLTDGEYTYIEVLPTEDEDTDLVFDRISYTTVDALSALSAGIQICGVYYRPDSDGDGIPDCADNDNPDGDLKVADGSYHTCYGNTLDINLTGESSVKEVYIYAFDGKKNLNCKGSVSGTMLTIPAKALPVGEYELYIYSDAGLLDYDIEATVHPTATTWKKNNKSTDWNDWDNWTDGSPWSCTDVTIPSNASIYPELKEGDANYCRNIHFEHGAEAVGLNHLKGYDKAFVDLTLQGGSYYLLSAPLMETVTGDMFISPGTPWGKADYFTVLSADNYKESRNRPIVYQHFWSKDALEYDNAGNSKDVGEKIGEAWSEHFNAVDTKYQTGQGFLLRAGGPSDLNGYTFRFPKNHSKYHFYTSEGEQKNLSRTIDRNGNVGKLAMTGAGTVRLTNRTPRKIFLMGNPYMTHISIAELMKENKAAIKDVRVCRTRKFDPAKSVESQTVSGKDDPSMLIAPMEACFIVVYNDATELDVILTEKMLMQKKNN